MSTKMKYRMRRAANIVITVLFLLITSLQVNAAETEQKTQHIAESIIEPETIQVSELDLGDYSDKMTVGEKQLLSVTLLPLEASETTITYQSSDSNVASINGMGRITALMPGSTRITVSASTVSQSFDLRVVEEEDTTIPVTDIEIGEYESELEVEKTMSLSGTVVPSDATDSAITYTSSNPSVATVSSTGEVKGIQKGNVTIILSAGGVTKKIPLIVKVATAGITLNNDYLVLKLGATYQLSAKVTPAEANQVVTYRSIDTSIANVSADGLVTAKGTGSTTIIVSNDDISMAVSVIVNESVSYKEETANIETIVSEAKVYETCVLASDYPVIDTEMLRSFYETKQVLKIIGDGYTIEIDGKHIVNYNNEFYTDISIIRGKDYLSFTLNQGNELCGPVTVYFEEETGKYLYLYHSRKEKYERIETRNEKELTLSTAGEYRLCEKQQNADMKTILWIVSGGIMLLVISSIVYIIIKRKYWFW